MKTKLFFFLRDINQYDKNFTSHVFDLIPIIPFDIIWDDEKVNKYFNLDDKEIEFLKNYI